MSVRLQTAFANTFLNKNDFIIWIQNSLGSNNNLGSKQVLTKHWVNDSALLESRWPRLWTHWGREKNGRHFPDDIFKHLFLNEKIGISIQISLKFVTLVPIRNNPALEGDNALAPIRWQGIIWANNGLVYWRIYASISLNALTHIPSIRPQCVKSVNSLKPNRPYLYMRQWTGS